VRIWIDLANSPHVPFFAALIPEFQRRGHEVEVSARHFAQTIELAENAGLNAASIGGFGGRGLLGKASNLLGRVASLAGWARPRDFDLAVSHNSYSQIVAARLLGIRCATLMDYEHQPANHVAFRLASSVIVPESFPTAMLDKYGAAPEKVRRYQGIKEDVYLADFQPAPAFKQSLRELGIAPEEIVVLVRPPARDALYHRFENELFDELMAVLASRPGLRVVFLPRTEMQRKLYVDRAYANFIFPAQALDGSNLIHSADLVVSAGGTMNREAAALGVPAATIYAGEWAAIDELLVREGRLLRIRTREDFVMPERKQPELEKARRMIGLKEQVVDLILGAGEA
jgi:uncharacterized protein